MMDETSLLPDETRIYNANKRLIFIIAVLLLWVGVGFSLCMLNWYWVGIILILINIYFIAVQLKNLLANSPQVIINIHGITTIRDGFHAWEDIMYEGIEETQAVSARNYYLFYYHKSVKASVNIAWLDIKHEDLAQLLIDYRQLHSSKVASANK